MKFCGLLRRIGIVTHSLGLLLFLLAFMSANWTDMPDRAGSAGLWQVCYTHNFTHHRSNNSSSSSSSSPGVGVTPTAEIVLRNKTMDGRTRPRDNASPSGSLKNMEYVADERSPAVASVTSEGSDKKSRNQASHEDNSMARNYSENPGPLSPIVRPIVNKISVGGKDDVVADDGGKTNSAVAVADDNKDVDCIHPEPPALKMDDDGCWQYDLEDVDAYLHMVRALMLTAALCYAYGILNGSTRRARIQPRPSMRKQHRGEMLSYIAAMLTNIAVQIYSFGYRSDSTVIEFVNDPLDLLLGWSAHCARLSSFIVIPSVLLLIAPTLRVKLQAMMANCWTSSGCVANEDADDDGEEYDEDDDVAVEEGGEGGGRRRRGRSTNRRGNRHGFFADLVPAFRSDPIGSCFRLITCRGIPRTTTSRWREPTPLETEMGVVDFSRRSGHRSRRFQPGTEAPDPFSTRAPPPPYSFLHHLGPDGTCFRPGSISMDSNRQPMAPGTDEQCFLVSGYLSVSVPPGHGGLPGYHDITPPPSYEEVIRGLHGAPVYPAQVTALQNGTMCAASSIDATDNPSRPGEFVPTAASTSNVNNCSTPIPPMPSDHTINDGAGPNSEQPLLTYSCHLPNVEIAPPGSILNSQTLTPEPGTATQTPSDSPQYTPTSNPTVDGSSRPSSSTSSSFSISTTAIPVPQTAAVSTSTSGLNENTDTTIAAAQAAAAAVVSAAAATTARNAFTLPALRPFPQTHEQSGLQRSPASDTRLSIDGKSDTEEFLPK